VQLLVRPQAARLLDDDNAFDFYDSVLPDKALGDQAVVEGTIIDSAYRGWGYEHVINVPGGRLSGVPSERKIRRGTHVKLTIDPNWCFVTPDDCPTSAL
jgi:hypothetical protein